MPWLRYWIVLAFALVMELLLEKIDGVYFTLFKLIFVLWCISPVYYNGSQVVFTQVLLPLHGIVQYAVSEVVIMITEICATCMDIIVEFVTVLYGTLVQPVFGIALDIISSTIPLIMKSFGLFDEYSRLLFNSFYPEIFSESLHRFIAMYKKNQENPRLISKAFKDFIRG